MVVVRKGARMKRYSKPYKRGKRLFRYDFERHIVEYVYKATEKERAENDEWRKTHRSFLYDIDEQGMIVLGSVGLMIENWKDKEARDEYLDGWNFELDEEESYMVRDAAAEFGF